jgi:hypothetical protein
MAGKDPVREWLKERGCPERVVKGGLAGLTAGWESTVAGVARGYDLGLDDYLNDMDGRELLHGALAKATASLRGRYEARIEAADRKIQAFLLPPGKCLWGAKEARARGWTPETNWWYFRLPRKGVGG